MGKFPTIRITEKVKTKLDSMKVHKNQAYSEIIEELVKRKNTQ